MGCSVGLSGSRAVQQCRGRTARRPGLLLGQLVWWSGPPVLDHGEARVLPAPPGWTYGLLASGKGQPCSLLGKVGCVRRGWPFKRLGDKDLSDFLWTFVTCKMIW